MIVKPIVDCRLYIRVFRVNFWSNFKDFPYCSPAFIALFFHRLKIEIIINYFFVFRFDFDILKFELCLFFRSSVKKTDEKEKPVREISVSMVVIRHYIFKFCCLKCCLISWKQRNQQRKLIKYQRKVENLKSKRQFERDRRKERRVELKVSALLIYILSLKPTWNMYANG